MQTLIRYLKLPFRFPVEQMQQEVSAIAAGWKAHYNKRDYEGSWTALPLRSVNGDMGNVIADGGEASAFKDTSLMDQCPTLKMVADTLQCDKNAIRLLNLQPGAIIKEHRDAELYFESGEARIHVPILTNDAVEFYLDGERVVMDSG
ncbi:MAG: aspartyl/asparaginyl beta-hydroxylase protein, partial [Flavipsychrobacter sp.]|nr:aspartyl/asparaginyl beta-hydroxylase protein [Flavipsychrobacter sp.]